jgi:hypothetical protein
MGKPLEGKLYPSRGSAGIYPVFFYGLYVFLQGFTPLVLLYILTNNNSKRDDRPDACGWMDPDG